MYERGGVYTYSLVVLYSAWLAGIYTYARCSLLVMPLEMVWIISAPSAARCAGGRQSSGDGSNRTADSRGRQNDRFRGSSGSGTVDRPRPAINKSRCREESEERHDGVSPVLLAQCQWASRTGETPSWRFSDSSLHRLFDCFLWPACCSGAPACPPTPQPPKPGIYRHKKNIIITIV